MTQGLYRITLGILAAGLVTVLPATQMVEAASTAPQIFVIAQDEDTDAVPAQPAETLPKKLTDFVNCNVAVQKTIKGYVASLRDVSEGNGLEETVSAAYEKMGLALNGIVLSVSELEESIPEDKLAGSQFSDDRKNIEEAVREIQVRNIVLFSSDSDDLEPFPGLTEDYIKDIQSSSGETPDGRYGVGTHTNLESFLDATAEKIATSSQEIDKTTKAIIADLQSPAGKEVPDPSTEEPKWWEKLPTWLLPAIALLAIVGFMGFRVAQNSRSGNRRLWPSTVSVRRQRSKIFPSFLRWRDSPSFSDPASTQPAQPKQILLEEKRSLEMRIDKYERAYDELFNEKEALSKENKNLHNALLKANAEIQTMANKASSDRRSGKQPSQLQTTDRRVSKAQPSVASPSTSNITKIYNSNPGGLKSLNTATVTETKHSQGERRVGRATIPILNEDSTGNFWILKDDTRFYLVPKPSARFNKYNSELLEALFDIQGGAASYAKKFQLLKPASISATAGNAWQVIQKGAITFN